MEESWRFLLTGYHTAAENMAIDHAILTANSKGLVPPTVRFYGWNPSAISIGYFQHLTEEIDIDACHHHGVEYVRRITGGGAVFHEHELTYSIVVSEDHPKISKNILESYKRICGAVMNGLTFLDLESTYAPINDILVNGKKISGNAQTRKYKTVLQHGTVLIDVDVDKMFQILKVPDEKIKDKMISDVKQRVTSIRHQLQHQPSFDVVADAMKNGFEDTFDVHLEPGDLCEEEKEYTRVYQETCFSTPEWNHKR
jgi:lipoate---protein ligase